MARTVAIVVRDGSSRMLISNVGPAIAIRQYRLAYPTYQLDQFLLAVGSFPLLLAYFISARQGRAHERPHCFAHVPVTEGPDRAGQEDTWAGQRSEPLRRYPKGKGPVMFEYRTSLHHAHVSIYQQQPSIMSPRRCPPASPPSSTSRLQSFMAPARAPSRRSACPAASGTP